MSDTHASDCSVHNEPAYRNGPCDCGMSDERIIPEASETPVSSPDEFVAATENAERHADAITGKRQFVVLDMLAAKALHDWSEPLQLRLVVQPDGLYDLIARRTA